MLEEPSATSNFYIFEQTNFKELKTAFTHFSKVKGLTRRNLNFWERC